MNMSDKKDLKDLIQKEETHFKQSIRTRRFKFFQRNG